MPGHAKSHRLKKKEASDLNHRRIKEHVDEIAHARWGDVFPETGVGKTTALRHRSHAQNALRPGMRKKSPVAMRTMIVTVVSKYLAYRFRVTGVICIMSQVVIPLPIRMSCTDLPRYGLIST
jgi:hypothetical protein